MDDINGKKIWSGAILRLKHLYQNVHNISFTPQNIPNFNQGPKATKCFYDSVNQIYAAIYKFATANNEYEINVW